MQNLKAGNAEIIRVYRGYINSKDPASMGLLRPSRFLITEPYEDAILVFNTLTSALISLSRPEYEALFLKECSVSPEREPLQKELSDSLFLLPDGVDEYDFVDDLRFLHTLKDSRQDHINRYYVYTTTGCNARCSYCYEEGIRIRTMSTETAHAAADYMIKYAAGHPLSITWFGGEPLLNEPVIDIICKELEEAGCAFESRIKTNASLFHKDRVPYYRDRYRLNFVQIPLDGIGSDYNQVKSYVNFPAGTDPFLLVMENAKALLDAGIRVDFRFNISPDNASNIASILTEIKTRFSGYEGCAVYPQVLNEGASDAFTKEERQLLFEAQKSAYRFLLENGIRIARDRYTLPSLRLHSCLADDWHAAGISPEGDLYKCPENLNCPHVFGSICDAGSHEDSHEKEIFFEQQDWLSCKSCPFYPNCVNLKLCVARGRECDEFHYGFREWKVRRIMRQIAGGTYSVGESSSR